ncbi:hypothetical protein FMN52_14525 [Marinobacter sp. BW6]|uniref:hypothetical protein n=1 Tax=Marinobacter sp. BW6 TaxID=2592624 RepID=UPI0011DEE1C6|nr:hypothetical protein [Marinobacter sp. BW6]TYC57757.1 hypothetical protein FMN52_14525 [Marinobacter sp. BW6]
MAKQHFRYSASILKTGQLLGGLGALLTFMLGSLFLLELPNLSEMDLAQIYKDDYGNVHFDLQILVIVALIGALVAAANRKVKVSLDSETVSIKIPKLTGLGLMGLTTGEHRIPLHTIRKIELTPVTGFRNMAQAIQQSRLSLITDSKTYLLQPYNFLRVGAPDHRLGLAGAFGKPKARVEAIISEAPLVRALSEAAGEARVASTPVDRTGPLAKHFNLLKHRGMLIELVLLSGMGLYALTDYLVLTNYLILGDLPIWPFVSMGLLAGALGIRLGRGAPGPERLGVAAMLCIVAIAATYPGIQRYTLIASPEPVPIAYEMVEAAYFQNSSYPAIDQRDSNIREYWDSLQAGTDFSFSIHKPVLGFAMVDMSPVYEKSRAFYRAGGQ